VGASGWSYFVPYQADIEAALQNLRQEAFAQGNYYNPIDSDPGPQTMEELIQLCDLEGTHSVIDMTNVSTRPDFGVVSSLTKQEYLDIFQTATPTREMIERAAARLQTLRDGWQGVYVLAHTDGVPTEIFFTGFSGD